MKNFPKTKNRFIVYFDLMGFKDLVYRNNHSDISRIMDIVCSTAKSIKDTEMGILEGLEGAEDKPSGTFTKTVVLPVVFSDSILFVSKGNTIFDAKKSIYVASYFLYKLLSQNIPVKGALAYGTFTADFDKSSFFGRPLIDAYLLANEANFYGAILHNTFDSYLKTKKKSVISERMLKRAPIPMKGGAITHNYVDWGYFKNVAGNQEDLIEKFYDGVSGNTRIYVDNTKKVYLPSPPLPSPRRVK